jgi:hypothetical protein
MANNQRQTDDIIRNYEPFIQNKLSKLKRETTSNRVLILLTFPFFLLAFQNDVESKPKPINVNINNTINLNITPRIVQFIHYNPTNTNKNTTIDDNDEESEDEDDDPESENEESSEDEVIQNEACTPPPAYNNANDKADK